VYRRAVASRSPGIFSQEELSMTVAKIIEISSDSTSSFQDAIETGIRRAERTVKNVRGAWVSEQKLTVDNGKITSYRVIMRVSFVID
jgi:flavin-binding protein dodecin